MGMAITSKLRAYHISSYAATFVGQSDGRDPGAGVSYT
jgi:hypothetical protein